MSLNTWKRPMGIGNKTTSFQFRLISRLEVAERTVAFYFERPEKFSFKAGQFIDLFLLNSPAIDPGGNARAFTIASAPFEEHLMVVTRLRNTPFNGALSGVPIESKVRVEGPSGNLILPNATSRPLVFLAGGIGVTPFRSMIVQAAAQALPHKLFLFYANRRSEDAPFLKELDKLQHKNPHYTFIGTITKPATTALSWSGEIGYLNYEMLARYLGEGDSPIYYVVGPPSMVNGLRGMLNSAGVSNVDIRTEEFSGY